MGAAAVGLVGTVVTRIRGASLPGEVRVVHDGLAHIYIAYAEQALPVGAQVLVIDDRGGRRLDVEPWGLPVLDSAGTSDDDEGF